MIRSGTADLPLHYGKVPSWLYERMTHLGGAIVEAIVAEFGTDTFLQKLSDPFWFQSMGCVLGMDWHSSGITTSVLGALKNYVNPRARELGIFFCGGRGKHSRKTPDELIRIASQTGLNGAELVRCSKLSAKIDNTAIQDGFQLYLHSFVVSKTGAWTVVQQGMNDITGTARRYHWHSKYIKSFVEEPHTAVCGQNMGSILNLTDKNALTTRNGILNIAREEPTRMIKEITKLVMPNHHDVRAENVDIKRLGSTLALAQNIDLGKFEELLLLKGLGPRTLQSLVMVSEIICGTPSRFNDPARFSFAHGGKDGHPFPVPTKVYDQSIGFLNSAVEKAKIGLSDKQKALKKLSQLSWELERHFVANNDIDAVIEHEKAQSQIYGGKTVFDEIPKRTKRQQNGQLRLFG